MKCNGKHISSGVVFFFGLLIIASIALSYALLSEINGWKAPTIHFSEPEPDKKKGKKR